MIHAQFCTYQHGYLCDCGDTDAIYGQLVLVDVMHLLEDVVEVPDLDASVDGGGDDTVFFTIDQRLYLNDPLKVSTDRFDKLPIQM